MAYDINHALNIAESVVNGISEGYTMGAAEDGAWTAETALDFYEPDVELGLGERRIALAAVRRWLRTETLRRESAYVNALRKAAHALIIGDDRDIMHTERMLIDAQNAMKSAGLHASSTPAMRTAEDAYTSAQAAAEADEDYAGIEAGFTPGEAIPAHLVSRRRSALPSATRREILIGYDAALDDDAMDGGYGSGECTPAGAVYAPGERDTGFDGADSISGF